MAKNIPLTTIGVKVSWAVETVAGQRPTTGYTILHGIYSTPDLNIAPSTADVTSFDDVKFTRKVSLLREIPDQMEYGVRYGKQAKKDWDGLIKAYETAKAAGLEVWICEDIPDDDDSGFENAYFYTVAPIPFEKPALESNNSVDAVFYATYTGSYETGESPEYKEGPYTVTYDANGGSWADGATKKTEIVEDGGHPTKPNPDPTKSTYSFTGWKYNGTSVNFSTFTVNSDVTIVAQWA